MKRGVGRDSVEPPPSAIRHPRSRGSTESRPTGGKPQSAIRNLKSEIRNLKSSAAATGVLARIGPLAFIRARLHPNSVFRKALGDPKLGEAFLKIVLGKTNREVHAWLVRHGFPISLRNVILGCHRVLAAAEKISMRSQALQVLERNAIRRGSSLAQEAMKQQAAGLADIMDAAAEKNPQKAAKLVNAGLGTITRVVNAEARIEANKLKKQNLELALRKYRDATTAALDKALREFAKFVKKYPELCAAYETFDAAVHKAAQEAAA